MSEVIEEAGEVLSGPEEFFEEAKIAPKLIDLPNGKKMWVRAISGDEIKQVNKKVEKDFGGRDVPLEQSTFREWVVIYGAMKQEPDGTFKQMFGSQHIKSLKASAVGWIATAFNEILKTSGLTKDAVAKKEVELEQDPLEDTSTEFSTSPSTF